MSRGNFDIVKATNGLDAIQKVKQAHFNSEKPYSYIFMDLNLPILDGLKATTILREMDKNEEIDLSQTKIYMHSAIQSTVADQRKVFDGICKLLILSD